MSSKFYAVKTGRTTGIFNSWEECKAQVEGYPNACYKSFKTAAEAAEFIGLLPSHNTLSEATFDKASAISSATKALTPVCGPDEAVAYVDGSYNIATGEYGYGVVFFYEAKEIHLKKCFPSDELATMRNVAGEIKGSEAAIRYAIDKNLSSIKIYYDYEGISKWCSGEWKANKEGTVAYRRFYLEAAKSIDIQFIKVKGHSGDKYNDVADRLAKEAVGII